MNRPLVKGPNHLSSSFFLKKKVTLLKGKGVQEIRQVFASWVSQVVRLYKNAPYAEFEYTIGPIKNAPHPQHGKEIISRFDTTLETKSVFYTDANGREMQKRTRNFRPTWHYKDTEPVAGNYYPVNSRAYIRDENSGVQFTVLTDRSLGGSSLRDGALEVMVHRRMLCDDGRGVNEALNEPGRDGLGLIVRGRFMVLLEAAKTSGKLHRVLGEEEMLRPLLAFSPWSGGGGEGGGGGCGGGGCGGCGGGGGGDGDGDGCGGGGGGDGCGGDGCGGGGGSGTRDGGVRGTYQGLARPLPINVHLLTLEAFDKVGFN